MSVDERKLTTQNELTDFLLYTAPDRQVKVKYILHDETICLTQNRITELFGVQCPSITKHLKNIFESGELEEEHITKSFVMDDERLKNGQFFGKDYFRELLGRVRSIRASGRRIYQQITDIFQTFWGISVYLWFRPSSCLSSFSWLKNIPSASSVVNAGGGQ